MPEIDLFATWSKSQFAQYCSLQPDPYASCIDAVSSSLLDLTFYCFPPFSCILQVLQKSQHDSAMGGVVVPNWPTQIWYPYLLHLPAAPPLSLKSSKNLLSFPGWTEMIHPLYRTLNLMVCLVSGNVSPDRAYRPLHMTYYGSMAFNKKAV